MEQNIAITEVEVAGAIDGLFNLKSDNPTDMATAQRLAVRLMSYGEAIHNGRYDTLHLSDAEWTIFKAATTKVPSLVRFAADVDGNT